MKTVAPWIRLAVAFAEFPRYSRLADRAMRVVESAIYPIERKTGRATE